jgi:hypothetical protein
MLTLCMVVRLMKEHSTRWGVWANVYGIAAENVPHREETFFGKFSTTCPWQRALQV